MAIFGIERGARALTYVMKSESGSDWRKRGSASGIEPVRPRREGIGRALNSIFVSNAQVTPIDLEALLQQLDDKS